jgi:hypothetical protein
MLLVQWVEVEDVTSNLVAGREPPRHAHPSDSRRSCGNQAALDPRCRLQVLIQARLLVAEILVRRHQAVREASDLELSAHARQHLAVVKRLGEIVHGPEL